MHLDFGCIYRPIYLPNRLSPPRSHSLSPIQRGGDNALWVSLEGRYGIFGSVGGDHLNPLREESARLPRDQAPILRNHDGTWHEFQSARFKRRLAGSN